MGCFFCRAPTASGQIPAVAATEIRSRMAGGELGPHGTLGVVVIRVTDSHALACTPVTKHTHGEFETVAEYETSMAFERDLVSR